MGNSEKSIVGDPILWPGLVYSPLNLMGVVYAFGIIARSSGIMVEEFSESNGQAVCRRKTDRGWEKVTVAFAVRSSELTKVYKDVDMLVCWVDDSSKSDMPVTLELKKLAEINTKNVHDISSSEKTPALPENIKDDFLAANEVRESFEETIRQFDDRIKKLKDH